MKSDKYVNPRVQDQMFLEFLEQMMDIMEKYKVTAVPFSVSNKNHSMQWTLSLDEIDGEKVKYPEDLPN